MKTHIFADWHNIRKGAIGASMKRNFQIDTNELYNLLTYTKARDIVYGNVYGANIDKIYFNHNLWRVKSFEPSPRTGKEKGVDTSIAVDIMNILHHCDPSNTSIILVSGDFDFHPVVKEILKKGVQFEIWSFEKALSTKLLYVPRINYLDNYLNCLKFKKYQRIPVESFDEYQTPGMA